MREIERDCTNYDVQSKHPSDLSVINSFFASFNLERLFVKQVVCLCVVLYGGPREVSRGTALFECCFCKFCFTQFCELKRCCS